MSDCKGNASKMDTILLVANGDVDLAVLEKAVGKADFVVGVDGGTNVLYSCGIWPHLVIGDMDSIDVEVLAACMKKGIEVLEYPSEKDETDLELAVREAIGMSPREIVCAGILGNRPDHTLANLQLLQVPAKQGIRVKCYFETGVLYAVNNALELEGKAGDTVSLLPITEKVTGITLEGFKYLLEDGEMISGSPLGISNELVGDRGAIRIKEGVLLVFHITSPGGL